ncbi:MAG TPA: coenzyme F420-0:L-glutamate ligase [Chloroflexota bacterium]|nr:coenzyme F420-0:L-glutamate ligase [Chloroflexota bacterium]
MQVQPVRTRPVRPGEHLLALLDAHLPPLADGDVLAVTSKIVALCQDRVARDDGAEAKRAMIRLEAEYYLTDDHLDRLGVTLTVAGGVLIPNAGIDESNGAGTLVRWPSDMFGAAREVWHHLRGRHRLDRLGIVITDSHTTPLRWGVTGIGLAWCGFEPLRDYVGRPDVFGRPMRLTKANLLDALAASAVLVMGEGAEQTPLAIIRDLPGLAFQTRPPTEAERQAIRIAPRDDLYGPLLRAVTWQTGGASSAPTSATAQPGEPRLATGY